MVSIRGELWEWLEIPDGGAGLWGGSLFGYTWKIMLSSSSSESASSNHMVRITSGCVSTLQFGALKIVLSSVVV